MLGDYNKAQIGLEGYYIGVILPKNELRCNVNVPGAVVLEPRLMIASRIKIFGR